jgi:hypothetical protein
MPSSFGRSPKKIAQQQAAHEKKFMDSANARAVQLGITLPPNFYELSQLQVNQKTQYPSKSFTGSNLVDSYVANKKTFVTNAVVNAGYNYAYMGYGRTSEPDETATKNLQTAASAAYLMGIPISTIQSDMQTGAQQFGGSLPKDDFLTKIASYVAPLAIAYFVPQMGASFASALTTSGLITTTAMADAVGAALASTAVQVAQGVPFDQALKNATVNAIVQTGSQSVATEINKVVNIPAVSDAITSAGASAIQTGLTGGSIEDIKKNVAGAISGSLSSSATDSRLIGSAVGGGVTGGVEGAFYGAAGEFSKQSLADQSKRESQKGTKLAFADTDVLSDVPSLSPNIVTAKQSSIQDTDIITPSKPYKLPESSQTKTSTPRVSLSESTSTKTGGKTDMYKPSLFIYGGKSPQNLGQTLGTSLQGTTTGISGGLAGERGAGELESKETGKTRQNVWNEASLRLKDALGV